MRQQEWLTAGEVAEIYRIKVGTIRLWTRAGMPYLRVGQRLVRFDPVQVAAWLKRRSRPAPALGQD